MTKLKIVNKSADQKRRGFMSVQMEEQDRIDQALTDPDCGFSFNTAISPDNTVRNRYSNVFPFDYNRVVLPTVKHGTNGYINASRIQLSESHKYIATQGPLESTTAHFWAMSWNELECQGNDTIIVVMVTPLIEGQVKKCHKYWPLEGNGILLMTNQVQRDDLNIIGGSLDNQLELLFEETYHSTDGQFEHSILKLKSGDKIKTVHHLYYYVWADCKIPPSLDHLYSLSETIKTIKYELDDYEKLPIPIIHCSAGVGRTGTFIALDYLSSVAKPEIFENKDPVESVVRELRTQRVMMVQTVHQFNFLYEVLNKLENEENTSIFKRILRKLSKEEVKA